jgi:hypothetical protein
MTNLGRASLFVLSGIAVTAVASSGCSSQDNTPRNGGGYPAGGSSFNNGGSSAGTTPTPTAGTATSSSGSGGASSSAGTASGTAGGPPSCMILPVANPTLSEFTPPDAAEAAGGADGAGGAATSEPFTKISFGYDADPPTVASGFSFFYPEGKLTSDMSGGAWHVAGSVDDYAAFQIAFLCGADAKAFKGISFKISGNAGPSGALSFVVAHASDSWRNPAGAEPTAASCASANQYDGTCNEAAAAITVAEEATTVSLMWADIKGGKPEASPDPAEILALRWIFKWDQAAAADAAAHKYDVDVSLDDLKFIE